MSTKEKLKKILIKTKRQIFSEVPGNNRSIFEGEGFDFVELREYSYGDDVRKIDWNVTAKMQRPFVKIFHEERELNIVIVSLLSGSVHFGQKKFKQETIAEISALLSFSAVKNGDLFSSYIYTNEIKEQTKASKSIHAVHKATEDILNFKAIGHKIDMAEFSKTMFDAIKRRSIIFVIGDFFGNFDFKLLAKKHEVIAVIVRDRLEENPPALGTINLIDPNSLGSALMQLDDKSIKRFKEKVHENDHKLFTHFKKNRIAFAKVFTSDDPYVQLSKLFIRR